MFRLELATDKSVTLAAICHKESLGILLKVRRYVSLDCQRKNRSILKQYQQNSWRADLEISKTTQIRYQRYQKFGSIRHPSSRPRKNLDRHAGLVEWNNIVNDKASECLLWLYKLANPMRVHPCDFRGREKLQSGLFNR